MKIKRKVTVLCVIGMLGLSACNENSSRMSYENITSSSETNSEGIGDYRYDNSEEEVSSESEYNGEEDFDKQLNFNRKLIKNATLSFETDSLLQQKMVVDRAIKKYNGYLEHEEQYETGYEETIHAIIRIPSYLFDDFMEDITAGVGGYDSKTIKVDDVTEEYVDIEARIHTKKELKERFIKLLDKAETIKKIMEVEREISGLQAEIESFEGRLKFLGGSVKYATVDMTYYQHISTDYTPENAFKKAFKSGWAGIVGFCLVLVYIWPFILIFIALFILLRYRIIRGKRAKN